MGRPPALPDLSGMLTFNEVSEIVAAATGRKPPHISAIHRWRSAGVRGRKLKAQRIGSRWYTRSEWLTEFLVEPPAAPERLSTDTAKSVAVMLQKSWGGR